MCTYFERLLENVLNIEYDRHSFSVTKSCRKLKSLETFNSNFVEHNWTVLGTIRTITLYTDEQSTGEYK